MTYKTTRDIIIPAGTEIARPPIASTRWGRDYEGLVGLGDDWTGYFSVNLEGALKSGLVAHG